jgi:hypothetical protein
MGLSIKENIKKKPKRKIHQQKQKNDSAKNDGVSYVDEVGIPKKNKEIIICALPLSVI